MCTVEAGEFVDANFQRISPLVVRHATPAYLRVTDNAVTGATDDLQVQAFNADNVELGTAVTVSVGRLGRSNVFLGPLTFYPDGDPLPSLRAALAGNSPARSLPGGLSTTTATKGSQEKARTPPVVPFKLLLEYTNPNTGGVLSEQYTVVEGEAHNYAEKTYLKVSVVNPHKGNAVETKHGPPCALLTEVPMDGTGPAASLGYQAQAPPVVFNGAPSTSNPHDNSPEHGGDVLDAPGLATVLHDGVSQGRDQEGSFFLRAVARRPSPRDPSQPLVDFGALVSASACPTIGLVDDAEPLYIDLWIDQEDLFPRGQVGPARHPSRRGASKLSIDWIERQALDLFLDPNASADENLAFSEVPQVLSDAIGNHRTGLPSPGNNFSVRPYPPEYLVIHINQLDPGLRWGLDAEAAPPDPIAYPDAGMHEGRSRGTFELLNGILSHEARHVLQYRVLNANPFTYPRVFVGSVLWKGQAITSLNRLLDSRNLRVGGTNTEFDILPVTSEPPPENERIVRAALERDALRSQRHLTSLTHDANDLLPVNTADWSLLSPSSQKGFHLDVSASTGSPNLAGTMVKVEYLLGDCGVSQATRAGQNPEIIVADSSGDVSATLQSPAVAGTCRVRFTLIKPATLTSPEVEEPSREVQITVQ